MGRNATYLTEMFSGNETDLWTPCIYDFFCRHNPELRVSACIDSPSQNGPWYEARKRDPFLKVEGTILKEPSPDEFLRQVGATFGLGLMSDPRRFTTSGNIAGISPDIVIIRPGRQGVCIIENKPYYRSSFTGNQGPGGAYTEFVLWLNGRGIPCQYLIIHSTSWEKYPQVKQLHQELPGRFGSLLLEEIFLQMARHRFSYPLVMKNWDEFAEKGSDYA